MTYQQVKDTMTWKEKFTLLRLIRWMRDDGTGHVSVCSVWNKVLYRIAKTILRRDPWDRMEFYFGLVDDPDMDWDEVHDDIVRLRLAYN